MAGTYNGSVHGGNEFTGQTHFADVFDLNVQRWGSPSAPQPSPAGARPAGSRASGAARRPVPTSGPGVGRVATPNAPTGGVGRGRVVQGDPVAGVGLGETRTVRVGDPVGSGPGLGVVTVGDFRDHALFGDEYKVGDSTRTPIQIGGHWVPVDTGWSDGGDFEQRYGELGGSILGVGVMVADGWNWLNETVIPPFGIDWMGDGKHVTRFGKWD